MYSILISKILKNNNGFLTIWVSDEDDTKYADIVDITLDPDGNFVALTTKLKTRTIF